MITEKQAKMIAHVLHEIRTDWGIEGTLKVLERNKDHTGQFADIMAAAVSAARDPTTNTPQRIFEVRTHWPAKARAHLPRPEPCPLHIGQYAHNCICCAADAKAEPPPTYESENQT